MAIILGSLLLAIGMNLFLVPIKLSSGGVGTIGTVLLYTLNIPLSLTNIVLNLFIFGLAIRVLGARYILKTIVGTLFLSLFLEMSAHISFLKLDFLSSLLVGGVFVGLGVGLIVRVGGSSGGSDLLALVLWRYFPHISLANIIFVLDFLVIIVAGVIFSDLTISIYSLGCMFISSRVSDFLINIGVRAKSVYISSYKSELIKALILRKFGRGVTEFYTRGGFLNESRLVIFCVLMPKEVPRLASEIKKIDPEAFIVINDVYEVFGNGF